jgi:soluble lytic murein transglycosylase-like protein
LKFIEMRPQPKFFIASTVALLTLVSNPGHAVESVYSYTDSDGSVHLSNVPDDSRFSVLVSPAASVAVPGGLQTTASTLPEVRDGPISRRPYTNAVEQAANQFGLDVALLHAVIAVESAYNAQARSNKGAGGLMQLMPDTAKRYGVSNVFDPIENIRGGAQYLRDLLKLFDNDMRLALAAYNAGEGAVIKYGKRIPPYRETAAYVPRVVDNYQKNRMLM